MYLHIWLDYRRQCGKVWWGPTLHEVKSANQTAMRHAGSGVTITLYLVRCTGENNLRYDGSIWRTLDGCISGDLQIPLLFSIFGIALVIPGEQLSSTGWRAAAERYDADACVGIKNDRVRPNRSGQECNCQPIKSAGARLWTIAMHKRTLREGCIDKRVWSWY